MNPTCLIRGVKVAAGFGDGVYLEVEDTAVALGEALLLGNDPVQQLLVQGETGDGRQQPAVT